MWIRRGAVDALFYSADSGTFLCNRRRGMAGGDAKIKIRVGEVEIEYEGDAEFLKTGLLEVCKELSKLNELVPVARPSKQPKASEDHEHRVGEKHSTVDIANLLGAQTGPDLVMVAAAYLHFTEGKKEFSRAQVLDAMRTATGYWHENYAGNLSTSLKSLTKASSKSPAKLRVVKEGTYSLPAKEGARLGAELAKI
jgi:hypothetical protein